MNPGVSFLIWWAAVCAIVAIVILAGMNYDRIAVFVLSALNAPVYEEARRIAASIYNSPQQWQADLYGLKHERLGSIHLSSVACSLYLSGDAYGTWEPTAIERRLIWNAARWWQREYVKGLLRKELS